MNTLMRALRLRATKAAKDGVATVEREVDTMITMVTTAASSEASAATIVVVEEAGAVVHAPLPMRMTMDSSPRWATRNLVSIVSTVAEASAVISVGATGKAIAVTDVAEAKAVAVVRTGAAKVELLLSKTRRKVLANPTSSSLLLSRPSSEETTFC